MKRQLYGQTELPTIQSDNGPQFVSGLFESTCEQLCLKHERIPPRAPNMNVHIESFDRLLEDGCLASKEFDNYAQAYTAVVDFMEFYNRRQLFSSLHYMPPDEFHKIHQITGANPLRQPLKPLATLRKDCPRRTSLWHVSAMCALFSGGLRFL